MEVFLNGLSQAAFENWTAAVDPLHRLTWQTFVLLGSIVLVAAGFASLLMRYSWVWSAPTIKGAKIKNAAHMYQSHLRMSPEDYLALKKLKLNFESDQAKAFVNRDAANYYLVTIVEQGKPKALVYQELRLQMPTRKGRAAKGFIQLDDSSLTAVRLGNVSEDDDESGTEIKGTYDVYVRRVRWFDLRHWFLHPNREIRIVVWVTLITTTLPVLLDLLFG